MPSTEHQSKEKDNLKVQTGARNEQQYKSQQ